jgi:hypothetical protein
VTATANAASLALLTISIGVVLASVGLRKGLLQLKPGPRRCPTCGRRLRDWACWSCAHAREE